jgi:hypothetical protein
VDRGKTRPKWTEPNERRGCIGGHPRRIYTTKRTNTAANSELEFAPAGYFTAVLSVFQAHLPGHGIIRRAKPLDWKARGEESSDNTDPLVSHRKIDWLDSYSARCHRRYGYLLTNVSARDYLDW